MESHNLITRNLRGIGNLHLPKISQHLQASGDKIHLLNGKRSPLATFGRNGVLIGETNLTLSLPVRSQAGSMRYNLAQVINQLGNVDISVNHLGVGYQVNDIDEEVQKLVGFMKGSIHKVYEDPAGRDENMRWLFLGDARGDDPMFEIVLPHKDIDMPPHMQFDIDTDLSPEEIKESTSKLNGGSFLDWHLDIPDVGRVLSMGTYNNSAVDMRVGIGSNLRSKRAHRDNMIELN